MTISNRVLDFGLNVLTTESAAIYICADGYEPTTIEIATGTTSSLGYKSFGAGNVFGSLAGVAGTARKVSSASISDGTVVSSGTAAWWAAIASGSLHAYGPLASKQSVDVGNIFNLASFDIVIANTLPENLLTHSQDFNLWTPSAVTITSDVANDPYYSNAVVDRIVETTGLIGHSVTSNSINFVLGTTYTFSVFGKYENSPFIQLLLGGAAFGFNAWGDFDLQNGVLGTMGSSVTGKITNFGNGWYRCEITATATANAAATCVIFGANASNMPRAQSYTGSTSNTRLLVGAQMEVGAQAGPYNPTP